MKIGEEFTETFAPVHPWRRISKDELFQFLAPRAENYRRLLEEFLKKAIHNPQHVTSCDFINFIYVRLFEELIRFSEKMGEVIVTSQSILEELASGSPSCNPSLAGLCFQWWLTLRLLGHVLEAGYKIVYIDEAMNAVKIENERAALWLYFDSYTVYNSRPDILSALRPSDPLGGRIVEVKLSHRAFRDSINQIGKYIGVWGRDGVIVVIGTPAFYQDLGMYYVKVIDGIGIMDEETLLTALKELTNHLTRLINGEKYKFQS